MDIQIAIINGSTAKISYCGDDYIVCYWDPMRDRITSSKIAITENVIELFPRVQKLLQIKSVRTGKSYNIGGYYTPVIHLLPLFQYICNKNAHVFIEKIIESHKELYIGNKK